MRNYFLGLLLLSSFVLQGAHAAGIVRIADGDCTGLTAAAAAPRGQEALIVLARNGHYDACVLHVIGNITIEGAGATVGLPSVAFNDTSQVTIASGAQLTVHNANLGGGIPVATSPTSGPFAGPPAIDNSGTLVLDSVSIQGSDVAFGYVTRGASWNHFLGNTGSVILRNATIKDLIDLVDPGVGLLHGNVEITHSTIFNSPGYASLFGGGSATIANSIVVNTGGSICGSSVARAQLVSRGGNIVSDTSCSFNGPKDKVVGDARMLDFATHGGVTQTLALNYDSPAIGNGFLTNCEATDARGLARGQSACDSGAYEIGGGDGKLSATGMSGLYFNAANNGHYVSIQRLYGDNALVIWNTFDERGIPAWLYGVGTVSGNQIHVAQVAQNVGGKLQPDGNVTPATATPWGSFDVSLSDCYNASLSYSSPLPQFGTGRTTLQRLAFLDGVNCAL